MIFIIFLNDKYPSVTYIILKEWWVGIQRTMETSVNPYINITYPPDKKEKIRDLLDGDMCPLQDSKSYAIEDVCINLIQVQTQSLIYIHLMPKSYYNLIRN